MLQTSALYAGQVQFWAPLAGQVMQQVITNPSACKDTARPHGKLLGPQLLCYLPEPSYRGCCALLSEAVPFGGSLNTQTTGLPWLNALCWLL